MTFWKNRANRILLAVLLLSLALCVGFWFWDISWLLFLPALPAFCLQLLLCRMDRRKLLRAVPLLLAAAMAVLGFYYAQQPGFGESLFGVILLLGAISPAAGAALAWAAWGFCRFYRRDGNSR